jgi:hypothetical protein
MSRVDDRWQRVKDVFGAALELPAEAREVERRARHDHVRAFSRSSGACVKPAPAATTTLLGITGSLRQMPRTLSGS